jgi:hypothetical protein
MLAVAAPAAAALANISLEWAPLTWKTTEPDVRTPALHSVAHTDAISASGVEIKVIVLAGQDFASARGIPAPIKSQAVLARPNSRATTPPISTNLA